MCFRAVKYLPPRQSYWLYLIHPLSCLPPIHIDYSSMSWLRSKMAAALSQWRCYSLIAIWDFSLCGALGLLCLWQMLSYVHELSYKPMMCFSPSSPLMFSNEAPNHNYQPRAFKFRKWSNTKGRVSYIFSNFDTIRFFHNHFFRNICSKWENCIFNFQIPWIKGQNCENMITVNVIAIPLPNSKQIC